MSKAKVMTGAERKASILEAGAKLASKHGAANVTRRMVAKAAKVSEALVSSYMGGTADAQKLYARKAKALKLPLPDKAKTEAIGTKLRAHGPRKVAAPARKRSIKEVKAIKDKVGATKKSAAGAGRVSKSALAAAQKPLRPLPAARAKASQPTEAKPAAPRERKPAKPKVQPQPAPEVAQQPAPATAAREPKAPPANLVNLI